MKMLAGIFTLSLSLLLVTTTFGEEKGEATVQLKSTLDKVVAILQNPSFRGDEQKTVRRKKIRQAIKERFSFTQMSKLSLGSEWKKRSSEEKKEFVRLFSDLLEKTYIDKVEGYTDEKVHYLSENAIKKSVLITTKIINSKGVEMPVDYRLAKNKKGEWMVYDIKVEGVSLVKNYRKQFKQIIMTSSYDDLVKQLKEKLKS